MSRNGAGTFTTINTFTPNTTISSSDVNENFDDAGDELTNSVAVDGQSVMTGPLKAANGLVGAPSITFGADLNTGIYRIGADNLGIAANGTKIADISATGAVITGTFAVSGNTALTGTLTVGGSLIGARLNPPRGAFSNLVIKVASNTTVTVSADYVTTADGSSFQTTAVSSTVNLGTTGADALDTGTIASNTWYALHVVAKPDGTTKVVASTSASSPTMPADYTYKARIGWVKTASGSAQLLGTWQQGRIAQYIIGLAQSSSNLPFVSTGAVGTVSGTSPTLSGIQVRASAATGHFIPSTASRVNLSAAVGFSGGTGATVLLAPSSAYSGTNNGPSGSNNVLHPLFTAVSNQAIWMHLESDSVYWASSAAGGALCCIGWEDNI